MLEELLIKYGGIKFGKFKLRSGRISDYYVDIKGVSTNPEVLREIAQEISKKAKGYEKMAGMELGAVPLMAASSMISDLPYVIIRKEEKGYGISGRIIGGVREGEKVVIIEDVTTTGSSALEAAMMVRKLGGIVNKVICVVDREEGAEENLRKNGIVLDPILRISEVKEKWWKRS